MKKIIIIISFIILPFFANAQRIVIANSVQNYVYIGLPSFISFAVESYLCKDLLITSDNGTVTADYDPFRYRVIPERKGDIHFSIYKNDTIKTKVGSYKFEAKYLPEPTPYCGRKKGGDISISLFRVQSGISGAIEGVGLDYSVIFKGFTITIINANDKKIFTKKCVGNQYPADVVDAIHHLKGNDRVAFTDITCETIYKNTPNSTCELQPMIFRMVE